MVDENMPVAGEMDVDEEFEPTFPAEPEDTLPGPVPSGQAEQTSNSHSRPPKTERIIYRTISEGLAKIKVPQGGQVFYNQVQEFNRDVSVAVIRAWRETYNQKVKLPCDPPEQPKEHVRVLDALSATGLRAIRYAREVEGIDEIVANDLEESAVEMIKENVRENGLESKITVQLDDAVACMYRSRQGKIRKARYFDVIDIDPFGSPAEFIDAAVQATADQGLLCVTATDMRTLSGSQTPQVVYARYGGWPLRHTSAGKEAALRILLRGIQSSANRYGRHIEPLLSLQVDFYCRVFVRVTSARRHAMTAASSNSIVHFCRDCHALETHPLGVHYWRKNRSPRSRASANGSGKNGVHGVQNGSCNIDQSKGIEAPAQASSPESASGKADAGAPPKDATECNNVDGSCETTKCEQPEAAGTANAQEPLVPSPKADDLRTQTGEVIEEQMVTEMETLEDSVVDAPQVENQHAGEKGETSVPINGQQASEVPGASEEIENAGEAVGMDLDPGAGSAANGVDHAAQAPQDIVADEAGKPGSGDNAKRQLVGIPKPPRIVDNNRIFPWEEAAATMDVGSAEFMPAPLPPTSGAQCPLCNQNRVLGGPIWNGPLHSRPFLERILQKLDPETWGLMKERTRIKTAEAAVTKRVIQGEILESMPKNPATVVHPVTLSKDNPPYGTFKRMFGILTVCYEELDVPLFFDICAMSKAMVIPMPRANEFKSVLMNLGYEASGSHISPSAIKTDAPGRVVYDVMGLDIPPVGRKTIKKLKPCSIALRQQLQPVPKKYKVYNPLGKSNSTKFRLSRALDKREGGNWGPKSKPSTLKRKRDGEQGAGGDTHQPRKFRRGGARSTWGPPRGRGR